LIHFHPRPLLARLLSILMFCSACTAAERTQDVKRACQLRVTLPKTSYSVTEEVPGVLSISNSGVLPVAVAKPLLPSRWSITHVSVVNGQRAENTWQGSVMQGATSSGTAPRYSSEEYEIINPGQTFVQNIDIAWYLRDQGDDIAPGQYSLEFFYRHSATASERDLPLIPYELRSNVVEVSITGGG
jgi:hypothetical protein